MSNILKIQDFQTSQFCLSARVLMLDPRTSPIGSRPEFPGNASVFMPVSLIWTCVWQNWGAVHPAKQKILNVQYCQYEQPPLAPVFIPTSHSNQLTNHTAHNARTNGIRAAEPMQPTQPIQQLMQPIWANYNNSVSLPRLELLWFRTTSYKKLN